MTRLHRRSALAALVVCLTVAVAGPAPQASAGEAGLDRNLRCATFYPPGSEYAWGEPGPDGAWGLRWDWTNTTGAEIPGSIWIPDPIAGEATPPDPIPGNAAETSGVTGFSYFDAESGGGMPEVFWRLPDPFGMVSTITAEAAPCDTTQVPVGRFALALGAFGLGLVGVRTWRVRRAVPAR